MIDQREDTCMERDIREILLSEETIQARVRELGSS